jgi:hypothetical protein
VVEIRKGCQPAPVPSNHQISRPSASSSQCSHSP